MVNHETVEGRVRAAADEAVSIALSKLDRLPFDRPGAWWVQAPTGAARRCADLGLPSVSLARWRMGVRASAGTVTWLDHLVLGTTDLAAATPNRPRLRKTILDLAGLLLAMVEHLDSLDDAFGVDDPQTEEDHAR